MTIDSLLLPESFDHLGDFLRLIIHQKCFDTTFKEGTCEAVFSKLLVLPHVIVLSTFGYSPSRPLEVGRQDTLWNNPMWNSFFYKVDEAAALWRGCSSHHIWGLAWRRCSCRRHLCTVGHRRNASGWSGPGGEKLGPLGGKWLETTQSWYLPGLEYFAASYRSRWQQVSAGSTKTSG